jgi:putative ABC transport system permease protein
MLESIVRDVRFAARGLRRSPGFAAAAILTLALGIGATTTVFSVVYAIVFKPLPFPNADRLVRVVQLLQRPDPERPGNMRTTRAGLTPDQVTEWRATSRTFAEIGYSSTRAAVLTDGTVPLRMNGAVVSVSLFRALGVMPHRGRLFADQDEIPGNEFVIVLSHDTWRARFGAAETIVGETIGIDDRRYRVIGVMPQGFGFPSIASATSLDDNGRLLAAPEFWTPMVARPRPSSPVARGGMTLVPTYALLQPEVTLEQAAAEANTLMPARTNERFPVELVNARVEESRTVRPTLLVFQAGVLFVLFSACANVINLLLARTASRRYELMVRMALGASRAQIARYAIAEALILAAAGGVVGSGLAYGAVALFRTLPAFLLPRMTEVSVDGAVLTLATGLSLVAGLVVGLYSAIRATRSDLANAPGSRQFLMSGRSHAHHSSRLLLAAETAAGVILLAGAGLLLNSFIRLTAVDRGFDPTGVYTFSVSLPRTYDAAARTAFHDRFAAAVRALPGVSAVGASDYLPGSGSIGFKTVVDGQQHAAAVGFNALAPEVFGALRIPLRGRDFNPADRTPQASVAIVNETFARRFFPDRDPIGQRIGFQSWPSLEIVGVAGDTRTGDVTEEISPNVYLPYGTDAGYLSTYVIRGGTGAFAASLREVAAHVDSRAVVFNTTSLDTRLARTMAPAKLYGWTATVFAIVAVMLAALGLYSVLSYSIGARTREFGIRSALGASQRAIIGGVMREAATTVIPGICLGLVGAAYLSRFVQALLFGVTPRDPATYAAIAGLFAAVAALACYLPARRATRIDPVVALRTE